VPAWSAPVRFVECDAQGIVFNGHYLVWCDEATTSWLERSGVPYASLRARGLDFSVVGATLSWSSPARYGDVVDLHVTPERAGRTSWALRHEVRVGERLCCTVVITYVVTGEDARPAPLPDDLRAALQA